MELRHLRYFTAVAEEQHFHRAAERLHVAQPAVSEQVRKLELELGVRLLDRTNRSVSLTPAGAALLEDARRMLRLADDARVAAQRAHTAVTERVIVGIPADVLPPAVPRALRPFAAAHPDVEVRIQRDDPLTLLDGVRRGLVDAAVVCLPAPVGNLRVAALGEERAMIALSASHASASRAEIPLEHLDGGDAMVLPRSANPAFQDALLATTRDADIAVRLVEVPDTSVEQLLLAVADGRSMALLPASACDRHVVPGVRYVPVADPVPTCSVALVTSTAAARPLVAELGGMIGARVRLRPLRLAA
jgi:DNA-binding transcriptional LysR family regulator